LRGSALDRAGVQVSHDLLGAVDLVGEAELLLVLAPADPGDDPDDQRAAVPRDDVGIPAAAGPDDGRRRGRGWVGRLC
jgi:hypothetical protein